MGSDGARPEGGRQPDDDRACGDGTGSAPYGDPATASEGFRHHGRGVDRRPFSSGPRERTVGPDAGAPAEESGPDALANIVRRLSAWGRELAASDAGSNELLRGLKVIDDVVEEAFGAYHTWEARGEETGDLGRAIEALVGSSVDVREARKAALEREADPNWKAAVSDFPKHRRSAKPEGPQQAEVG